MPWFFIFYNWNWVYVAIAYLLSIQKQAKKGELWNQPQLNKYDMLHETFWTPTIHNLKNWKWILLVLESYLQFLEHGPLSFLHVLDA